MDEIVGSSHDTGLRITEMEQMVLDKVDSVIEKAVVSGNPQLIFRHGLQLRNAGHIAGIALAKLLYEGREHWEVFGSDDDFATVSQFEMGISGQTYTKYTQAWENVINNPYLLEDETLRTAIMGKPMQGLLLLRAAAREGQLEPEHWEAIANAPNVEAMRDVVKDVRGHQTSSKNVLRIVLQKDGKLKARLGGRPYQEVGYIKRDEDLVTTAVISRLESVGVIVEPSR